MVLVLFDPTRTAATHPPASAHLVDSDDADELAQVLYPLPADKHVINRILGTMGTAKGVMAFTRSLAHTGDNDHRGSFHFITTVKKRTVIFRPRQDTYLLAVFPADRDIPDAVIEDTVSTAWNTATLLFGPEPWFPEASEWWAQWEARNLQGSPNRGELTGWISGGVGADVEVIDVADTTEEIAVPVVSLQDGIAKATECIVTSSYAVTLTPSPTDTKTTIYQTTRSPSRTPLIHHLIDLIHSAQPPSPSPPSTRNRTRSPQPALDKPHHQASKWTTLSLGTGTIPFLQAHPSPDSTNKVKGKSIASWLGFGPSPAPPVVPINVTPDDIVPVVTTLDVPALDEALVTDQPLDLEWHVQSVYLPLIKDDDDAVSSESDEGQVERWLRRCVLVYTIHARTLIAVILDPHAQRLVDLSSRLNEQTDAHEAVQSVLSPLIRALQAPASGSTHASKPPHQAIAATQYVHRTRDPHERLVSDWRRGEVVWPAGKKEQTLVPSKARTRRDITVDHLGTCARQSLIQIDDAREIFARTASDVWVVGRRIPASSSLSEEHLPQGSGLAEEAYMVIPDKESSIVDAEYQLRRILKGQM